MSESRSNSVVQEPESQEKMFEMKEIESSTPPVQESSCTIEVLVQSSEEDMDVKEICHTSEVFEECVDQQIGESIYI